MTRRSPPAGGTAFVVALSLVATSFLALTLVGVTTLPWRGTADAYDHLDYVFQVAQGRLPGQLLGELSADAPGARAEGARQYASAHPPLYYAVMALLADPWLGDHWHRAILVIRSANVGLGLVGLGLLARLGWLVGGRRRRALAVGLPLVGGSIFPYLRFSAEVYSDLLVTVASLAALTVAATIVLRGLRWRWVLVLSLVCTVGMGSKATFVLTMGTCVLALLWTAWVAPGRLRRRLARGVAASALVVVPASLAFAWFYRRNAELSGAWYRSTPKGQVGDRERRGLADVLTDPDFYLIVPRRLVGQGADLTSVVSDATVSLLVFSFGAVLTVLVTAAALRRGPRGVDRGVVVVVLLLLAHLGGSSALQLSHAVGFGAYNLRYFLPSVAAIALLVGAGALSLGRWSAVAVPVVVLPLWVGNLSAFARHGLPLLEPPGRSTSLLGDLSALAGANGFPTWLPTAGVGVAVGCLAGLVVLLLVRPGAFAEPTDPGVDSAPTAPHPIADAAQHAPHHTRREA